MVLDVVGCSTLRWAHTDGDPILYIKARWTVWSRSIELSGRGLNARLLLREMIVGRYSLEL